MLFVGVLGKSWVLGFPLAFIRFFAGAYSLYLYTVSQHGKMSSFSLSFSPVKMRSFFIICLHWVPLNIFFLRSDVLLNWLYIISLLKMLVCGAKDAFVSVVYLCDDFIMLVEA